jgi:folylpolyglutamate synthase/dihydropteroate synthase
MRDGYRRIVARPDAAADVVASANSALRECRRIAVDRNSDVCCVRFRNTTVDSCARALSPSPSLSLKKVDVLVTGSLYLAGAVLEVRMMIIV